MLTFPSCKINLGLLITDKRPDGFHNLQSCFYPVRWQDVLEIIPSTEIAFNSSGLSIPGSSRDNLCLRAYNLLRTDFQLSPVQMHLHKIVPIGAGLGGGSADAAFTLKLLNEQFQLSLTIAQLEDYARRLGSDCAFFIQNRPLYCTEKGDVFTEINLDLAGYYIVLVYPKVAISTAEAYAGVRPKQPAIPLYQLLEQPIATWQGTVHNDFEDSLFPQYPILAQLKQQLYDAGAVYASMSGSGSTVYGIFDAPAGDLNQFAAYHVWEGKL